MIDNGNLQSVLGAKVLDRDGDKVGTVGQVYVDENDGHALFASVKTGFFGTSESFVPLDDADFDGEQLRVGYQKDRIKDAPNIDADAELSPDEESRIYDYYHGGSASASGDGQTEGTTGTWTAGRDGAGSDAGYTSTPTAGTDAGFETTGSGDDAMTRSEERLHVGTEQVQTGRARLHKYVVTDQQTVTVPVEHEEVRLEREPITDANVGDAERGAELRESDHEVTLTAERPVVEKETVPVERVRLGTETVTDQQKVTEDVHKEQIEFEDGRSGAER